MTITLCGKKTAMLSAAWRGAKTHPRVVHALGAKARMRLASHEREGIWFIWKAEWFLISTTPVGSCWFKVITFPFRGDIMGDLTNNDVGLWKWWIAWKSWKFRPVIQRNSTYQLPLLEDCKPSWQSGSNLEKTLVSSGEYHHTEQRWTWFWPTWKSVLLLHLDMGLSEMEYIATWQFVNSKNIWCESKVLGCLETL